ncbi:MAG: ATP-binding protein [Actinomycetota bacterium]|nr:ATP-binding protein [Actinomycetota bacterium]
MGEGNRQKRMDGDGGTVSGLLRPVNRAGLGTGMIVIALAFAAFTVIPALVAYSAMNASESAREDQARFHQLRVDAEALSGGLLEIQAAGRGFATTGRDSYAERASDALSGLNANLDRLVEDLSGSGVDPRLGEAVTRSVSAYVTSRGPAVRSLVERGPEAVRSSIATGEGQRLIDRTRAILRRAERDFAALTAESNARADTYSNRLRAANIVAVAGTLLTILLGWLYVTRSVLGPIRRLDDAALELGGGNESTRVQPDGAREVESLGRSFNEMAVMLQARQAELIAASRAKSEFLARMSHELRTPLNAILGFGQLLEMDDLDENEAESVSQILRAGRHLLDLIDEVLDISRIESGSLRISMEPVSLANVFGDVVSMTAPMADERSVNMSIESPGSDLHVLADQQRLKQILLNLLSNGIKYNRAGGDLTVRSETVDGYVRILVSDTGEGIPTDLGDRLFTPFERLGADQKGHVEGTGLGLALSERLATLMGGSLTLDRTGPDGTTFAIRLRQVTSPDAEDDLGTSPRRERNSDRELTVVCIEDNASNLDLVRRILDDHHSVRIYASIQGSIGLDLVQKHQPDLVLLDLHLPDISGEEVLSRLKRDLATAEIPVIIMSADATSGHQRRLVQAGAFCYLTKPLDVNRFLNEIDLALNDRDPDA